MYVSSLLTSRPTCPLPTWHPHCQLDIPTQVENGCLDLAGLKWKPWDCPFRPVLSFSPLPSKWHRRPLAGSSPQLEATSFSSLCLTLHRSVCESCWAFLQNPPPAPSFHRRLQLEAAAPCPWSPAAVLLLTGPPQKRTLDAPVLSPQSSQKGLLTHKSSQVTLQL